VHSRLAIIFVLATGAALTSDAAMPNRDDYAYAWPVGPGCKQRLERNPNWGNYVVVRHDDGIRTRYGHLVTPSPLAVDSTVAQGDVIGIAGQTETSYVHVHFEVESPAQREAWAKGRIDPVSVAGPLRRCRNSAAPR
jgi:murein DD-endopeptidase MepM/ murein hydrolase activator NlpD